MNDHFEENIPPIVAAVRKTLGTPMAGVGIPLAVAASIIVPPAIAQQSDDNVDEPPDVAGNESSESGELEEIIVHGKVRMRHKEAFSATKMQQQLKDIAQSVSVITEDLIDMANINKMQDIYRVDASAGSTQRMDDFPTTFFRGFRVQGANTVRVDGFRFPGNIDLDFAGFERIELVKGPTSALFGANSIGGTLNATAKAPTSERRGELGIEGGSWNAIRAELDISGPIGDSQVWQYRFIAVKEESDTYIDQQQDKAWAVIPSIAWVPSDHTSLVASINYQEHEASNHWGTGLQGLGPGDLRVLPTPRSHSFGQPWNLRNTDVVVGTVKFEHEFNNAWTIRTNVHGSTVNKNTDQCNGDGNSTAAGIQEQGCFTYFAIDDDRLFGGEVNLIGDFSLMGREHTLFFGVDYSLQTEEQEYAYDYVDDNGVAARNGGTAGYRIWPGSSAIHPQFDRNDMQYFYDHKEDVQFAGVTLQALLNPTDNLQVLLAGRFSFDEVLKREVRAGDVSPSLIGQPFARQPNRELLTDEFVPQIGITYSISDNANIYLNWGKTYNPDSSFARIFDPNDPNGKPLGAEKGEQIEIGFKAELLEDQLSVTGAVFDMERSNISAPDRQNTGFSLPVGGQRTKGAELGMNGNLTEAFDVFVSLAYLDAFYTGDVDAVNIGDVRDFAPPGSRPANTPKFAASIFANYAFTHGPLEGLGVGLAWVYKDRYDPWGRVSAEYEVSPGSGYVARDLGDVNEVDIRVHYEVENWEFYASVNDVFDDLYYSPVRAELRWGIHVNPGRNYTAGIKRRW